MIIVCTFMNRNNVIKTTILLVGLSVFRTAIGQQYPSFSHFAFNKSLFNPAYVGSTGKYCFNSVHHRQYRGLNEPDYQITTDQKIPTTNNLENIAPVTTGFGIQAPLSSRSDIGGAGLSIMNDAVAYEQNLYLKLNLAAAVPLTSNAFLRFGIEYSYQSKQLKNVFKPHQPGDPKIPVLFNPDRKGNLGAGIYYYNQTDHQVYIGVSVMQLLNQQFQYGAVQIQSANHYFLMSGMLFEQVDAKGYWDLRPSMLLKMAKDVSGIVRPTLDLTVIGDYNKRFAVGTGLRTSIKGQLDAANLFFGFYPLNPGKYLNQSLRIGYSYDIPLQNIASNGTHELQINFCFGLDTKGPIHPRDMIRSNKGD